MPARMEEEGGVTHIYYQMDGDDCVLTFFQGRVEQLRRGSVNIKLSFVCGQTTACIIGDENLRGGYKIYTTALVATVKQLGVNARIEYLSGEDREHICVKIRALATSR